MDFLKKLLEQGLPTMMFVLAATCLGLGFFDVQVSPFTFALRIYLPLVVIGLFLLLVATGLWYIDREKPNNGKPIDAEAYINGHYNLIRFLNQFSEVHDYRPPTSFSTVLTGDKSHSAAADQAANYAAMYLKVIGLLEPNDSGTEYCSSTKADNLLKNNDFRARNAKAFSD